MTPAPVLADLVIVVGAAALAVLAAQRLRLPSVLAYVVAGALIGPHTAFPLVADGTLVATLSELGVILLMFSIGSELGLRTIARTGLGAGVTALVEVGAMIALGYGAARALGYASTPAIFVGGCLGISSTMVVARALADAGAEDTAGPVFAILVFEDLIAIVLLAVLAAIGAGRGLDPAALASTVGTLAGVALAMVVGGLLVVPRLIRLAAGLGRREALLMAGLAVCFGGAYLAHWAGFSVALGAFIAGVLVAESGQAHALEPLIEPLRDGFGAVFFLAVGMTVDPALMLDHAGSAAVLTAVVLIGKPLAVTLGSFLASGDPRAAVRAGLTLGQIGEFSFIIAGVAISTGVASPSLLAVMVAVACVTATTTPLLVRHGATIAARVDARLPHAVQTFATFYESWLGRLRAGGAGPGTSWRAIRRTVVLLIVDAAVLTGVLVGAGLAYPHIAGWTQEVVGTARVAEIGLVVAAGLLALVFALGLARHLRRLATQLAEQVVPARPASELDLGRAPRRALIVVLEVALLLAVGLPIVVITLPVVPLSGLGLAVAVAGLLVLARRAIRDLDGHASAGVALLAELLATQRAAPDDAGAASAEATAALETSLPGFPGVAVAALEAGSPAIGHSLVELNLRARTGASVLVVRRGGVVAPPDPHTPLALGDELALGGTAEAIAAARAALAPPAPGPAPAAVQSAP